MKKCPACAEEIQDEAKKCKHCGDVIDGAPKENKVYLVVGRRNGCKFQKHILGSSAEQMASKCEQDGIEIVSITEVQKNSVTGSNPKCSKCGCDPMVDGRIKEFNGWGIVWAVIIILVAYSFSVIPTMLALMFGETAKGMGIYPVLIYYGLLSFLFWVSIASISRKVPAWQCPQCSFAFSKAKNAV